MMGRSGQSPPAHLLSVGYLDASGDQQGIGTGRGWVCEDFPGEQCAELRDTVPLLSVFISVISYRYHFPVRSHAAPGLPLWSVACSLMQAFLRHISLPGAILLVGGLGRVPAWPITGPGRGLSGPAYQMGWTILRAQSHLSMD